MSYLITQTEYLELNGVPLDTPAWFTTNLDVMWDGPDTRGEDVLIPGAAGVLARKRRITAKKLDPLVLQVVSNKSWDGSESANYRGQLRTNRNHLITNILTPALASATGTVIGKLHLPDNQGTLQAPVHVEQMKFSGDGPASLVCSILLTIPSGVLI